MAEFMSAADARRIALPALRRVRAIQYCEADGGIMDMILEASRAGARWARYDFGRFDANMSESVAEVLVEHGYKVKTSPSGEGVMIDINWE